MCRSIFASCTRSDYADLESANKEEQSTHEPSSKLLTAFNTLPLPSRVATGVFVVCFLGAVVSHVVSAGAVRPCGQNTYDSCNREFMANQIGHLFSVGMFGAFVLGFVAQRVYQED